MFRTKQLHKIQGRLFFYIEDGGGRFLRNVGTQTIRPHIPEYLNSNTPATTSNIQRVNLRRWRFPAHKVCQIAEQIYKLLLCFQNLNTLRRSTRRGTKGRMTRMTPGAPSVARTSQTLTSEYIGNKNKRPVRFSILRDEQEKILIKVTFLWACM